MLKCNLSYLKIMPKNPQLIFIFVHIYKNAMKDFSTIKVELIEEYTSARKRKTNEVIAFHSGLNYLIDYLSDSERMLNSYIPEEVMFNKRTCMNAFRLLKEAEKNKRKQELEELKKKHAENIFKLKRDLKEQIDKEAEKKFAKKVKEELDRKVEAAWDAALQKALQKAKAELRKTAVKEVAAEREAERKATENTIKQIKEDTRQKLELMKQRLVLQDVLIMEDREVCEKLVRHKERTSRTSDLQIGQHMTRQIHIVLAADSFKGCLSSGEVENAMEKGIRNCLPSCKVTCIPMSDGGEGIQHILTETVRGENVTVSVHDPLMRICEASYGIVPAEKLAFIETASASGLPLVPPPLRNPIQTTSYGTGELIKDALDKGCRNFIIGLGGSATNDAGMGMLQALGFRFLNKEREEIKAPLCCALLAEVEYIDESNVHPNLKEANFIALYDVQNPFCGPQGATLVFAPQKGADEEMAQQMESYMQKMARVIYKHTHIDLTGIPGTGAAGGIGGGLLTLLNAKLKPGIQFMMNVLHFRDKIRNADLIITGEGKADRQTLMGKVPAGVLAEAQKRQIPVVLLAGAIEDHEALNEAGFKGVFSIHNSPCTLEQAMNPENAQTNIKKTTEQILRLMLTEKE